MPDKFKHRNLILLLMSLTVSMAQAQCLDEVIYHKGLFYVVRYAPKENRTYLYSEGFSSYDGITKSTINTLAEKNGHTFHVYSPDSIGICSHYIQCFSSGNKWAVYRNGSKLSDFNYDYAYAWTPQDGKGKIDLDHLLILVRKEKNLALMDLKGKELTTFEYQLPLADASNYKDSTSFSCCDELKNVQSPGNCDDCDNWLVTTPVAHGLLVLAKNSLLGALDTLGRIKIPFIYDTLYVTGKGGYLGSRKGKKYFITETGLELSGDYGKVIPLCCGYDRNGQPEKFSGIYLVMQNGLWGLVNAKTGAKTKCVFTLEPDQELTSLVQCPYMLFFSIKKIFYDVEIIKDKFIITGPKGKDVTLDFIENKKAQFNK